MVRGRKGSGPDASGLKEAITVAYVRAGYTSLMRLSIASGVSYDTFMNWFGGKTRPRGHELQKVAATLNVPFANLEAAYEGRDPEPPPLTDAINDLVLSVKAQTAAVNALVGLLGPVVGTAGESLEIRLGAIEAELQSRRARSEDAGSPGPPVHDGSSG